MYLGDFILIAMPKERIVVVEQGADLLRDAVVRESVRGSAFKLLSFPDKVMVETLVRAGMRLPVEYLPPEEN